MMTISWKMFTKLGYLPLLLTEAAYAMHCKTFKIRLRSSSGDEARRFGVIDAVLFLFQGPSQ